jgi:hypothetical protein
MNAHQINAINARFSAADAYNRASRTTIRGDRQTGQLLIRIGDMMMAAAKSEAKKAEAEDRAAVAVAEWENANSWEGMPCGDEA